MTDTKLPPLSPEIAFRALENLPGSLQIYQINLGSGEAKWIYVGPESGPMFGMTTDELVAKGPTGIAEHIVEADHELMQREFMHGVATGVPVHYEFRVRLPNGAITHIESSHRMDRTDDGIVTVYSHTRTIDDRVAIREQLAASQRAVAEREALYTKMFDALPVGVSLMRPDGSFPLSNAAMTRMIPMNDADRDDLRFETQGQRLDVLRPDGSPFPVPEQPIARVLAGAAEAEDEMVIRVDARKGVRMLNSAFAMRDDEGKLEYVLTVSLDVTAQRELEDEIQQRNAQLAESEADKVQLIERLRHAVDELSTPILEVWDEVLLMPIIGLVDSRRAADMVARLLDAVVAGHARYVVIDLTGVEIVDTRTADHLIKLVKKVELVGARCVLTGIRPAVAQTLVDIGIDFGRLSTLRNLKHGLRDALSTRREWDANDDVLEGEIQQRAPRRPSPSR